MTTRAPRRPEGTRAAIGVGCLTAMVVALLSALDPASLVSIAREATFDRFAALHPRTAAQSNVVVIDIDRASLAAHGPWPWRRDRLATLIERANTANPDAIVVDILIEGADRNGPRAVLSRLGETLSRGDLSTLAESMPDDDDRLAAMLDTTAPVVLGLGQDARAAGATPPPAAVVASLDERPITIEPRRAAAVVGPPTSLQDAASGLGVLSFDADPDGLVRRVPLIIEVPEGRQARLHAGLALEAARVAAGASLIMIDPSGPIIEAGTARIPVDANATVRLYPRAPANRPRILSAGPLLAADAPKLEAARVVLIGSSAPEAGAYLPVAMMGLSPSLAVQAEAIDLILTGPYLTRPTWARWGEPLSALAFGAIGMGLAITVAPLGAAVLAGVGAVAVVGGSFAAFTGGVLIDPWPAALALLFALAASASVLFSRVRQARLAIEARFSRYLAPEIVARLASDPGQLRIAGERREVTALFTDLEGFTNLTERAGPEELVAVLDGYFSALTQIVVDHGGMVDKIVGDAVHAFFNMPLDQPDHADRAVACARAMLAASQAYRTTPLAVTLELGRTRIGVDTGPAIVGDVGGRDRLDYTAHGDAVIRAARLQPLNKIYGTSILIGAGTKARLTDSAALSLVDTIAVRGQTDAQPIYTVDQPPAG